MRSVVYRAMQSYFFTVHKPIMQRSVNLYQITLVRAFLTRQMFFLFTHRNTGAGRYNTSRRKRGVKSRIARQGGIMQVIGAIIAKWHKRSAVKKFIIGGNPRPIVFFIFRSASRITVNPYSVAKFQIAHFEPLDGKRRNPDFFSALAHGDFTRRTQRDILHF